MSPFCSQSFPFEDHCSRPNPSSLGHVDGLFFFFFLLQFVQSNCNHPNHLSLTRRHELLSDKSHASPWQLQNPVRNFWGSWGGFSSLMTETICQEGQKGSQGWGQLDHTLRVTNDSGFAGTFLEVALQVPCSGKPPSFG